MQRLLLERMWRCASCGSVYRKLHAPLARVQFRVSWPLGFYTSCVRCGTDAVRRPSRYELKARRRNIVDALRRALGRTTYRCPRCQSSYFDLRPSRWRSDGHGSRVRMSPTDSSAAAGSHPR